MTARRARFAAAGPPRSAHHPGRLWRPATLERSPYRWGAKIVAHGKDGFPLLFADGHAGYTLYLNINQTSPYGPYNFDWTVGGLATGVDLK